jgi:hypothetical protein
MQRSGELSGEALELARALGDRDALVEALCARLHALSGPDHIDALIEAADDLLARSAQDTWMQAEAHTARIGAFLHRGDVPAADAALGEAERVTREAHLPEAIWFHDRIRNQRRIVDGEFDAAKAVCEELGARAKRMGLGYGVLFLGAQRNAILLAQQGVEAARSWNLSALFALGAEMQPSYRAGLVALSAELGHAQEARRMLDTMATHGFADVPTDIGYLNTLAHLGRAAAQLPDREHAERLYALLAPYAHYNTPNSMLFYDGSVSHPLALLAASLGRDASAEEHFAAALAQNEGLGARPQAARVGYEYARWLAEHRSSARGRGMALRARTLADELGMPWLASSAAELVA